MFPRPVSCVTLQSLEPLRNFSLAPPANSQRRERVPAFASLSVNLSLLLLVFTAIPCSLKYFCSSDSTISASNRGILFFRIFFLMTNSECISLTVTVLLPFIEYKVSSVATALLSFRILVNSLSVTCFSSASILLPRNDVFSSMRVGHSALHQRQPFKNCGEVVRECLLLGNLKLEAEGAGFDRRSLHLLLVIRPQDSTQVPVGKRA